MDQLDGASIQVINKLLKLKKIINVEGIKYYQENNGMLIPLNNSSTIKNYMETLYRIQNDAFFNDDSRSPYAFSNYTLRDMLLHYLYEQNKIQNEQIQSLQNKINQLEKMTAMINE